MAECRVRTPSTRPLCIAHWLMVPLTLRRQVYDQLGEIGPSAIQPSEYSTLVASAVDAVRAELARRSLGAGGATVNS
jgi:hypothetical protein